MSHNIVIELHGPSQRAYAHRLVDEQPAGTVLNDFAQQVPWKINGVSGYITKEEWKDIFTSALDQDMRMAEGLRGGIVLIGKRTSAMSKRHMSELIALIHSEGDDRGIEWSVTSIGREAVPA